MLLAGYIGLHKYGVCRHLSEMHKPHLCSLGTQNMATTSLREGGPPLKGPFDFEDSPLSRAARQPLLLGVFLDLQDRKISRHPTTTTWTFDYNAEVVRKADELGFDIAFSRSC